jgi:hypothetical protein
VNLASGHGCGDIEWLLSGKRSVVLFGPLATKAAQLFSSSTALGQRDWFSRHNMARAPLYQLSIRTKADSTSPLQSRCGFHLGDLSRASISQRVGPSAATKQWAPNQWNRIAAASIQFTSKAEPYPPKTTWPRPTAGSACSSLGRRLASRNVKTTAVTITHYTLARLVPSTTLWIPSRTSVSPAARRRKCDHEP